MLSYAKPPSCPATIIWQSNLRVFAGCAAAYVANHQSGLAALAVEKHGHLPTEQS
jgi:hypothetical protein